MSNLLEVIGCLAKPTIQGKASAARFWAEKDMGYTDNNVEFVMGICHIFKHRYATELWKEWGKTNDVLTSRNILMKRMRMFTTRTGIKIDPSIYIDNRVMEELMKTIFSSVDLVPRFKDLERGNYILLCIP